MPHVFTRLAAACLITGALTGVTFAQDAESQEPHDHSAHAPGAHSDGAAMMDQDLPPVTHALEIAPDDHVVGSADAPVSLIIYASVTCPHCSAWFIKDWPKIKADFVDTGKVQVAMREFLTQPEQLAVAGFMIANCAPDGEFMKLVEHQMENQATIFDRAQKGEGQEVYLDIAKMAGLDGEEAMTECFKRESEFDHIMMSMRRAEAAGLDAVPNFFVNGSKHDGSTPIYEVLSAETGASEAKTDK